MEPSSPTTFRLRQTEALAAYQTANPYAVALKHAHSRENVEADWPQCVLEAIRFALYALKHIQPGSISAAVQVIAAGVSNGGGAVLRAAEADEDGLIHAVVAAEPNITPPQARTAKPKVAGSDTAHAGRALFDYATLMNLYLPAAILSGELEEIPFAQVTAMNAKRWHEWSRGLGRLGFLDGSTTQARAKDALAKIEATGFAPSSFALLHAMSLMQAWPTIGYAYANAYGRFGVEDALLGAQLCFADADVLTLEAGSPRAPSPSEAERLSVRSGGLTPGGGLCTLYSNGSLAQSLEDALTLRQLYTGSSSDALRVQNGINQITARAQNRGIPTLIVHGDSDPLISPLHSSRAYFDAAKANGQDMRNWRYYNVEGAQHFETLLMDESIAKHYQPQLPYFFAALDAAKAFMTNKTPLPASKTARHTRDTSAPLLLKD
jgi:hydroxybutyrate-dimer hydrolase